MATTSYDSAVQTDGLILVPEFILLLSAIAMMTASAFVNRPRRSVVPRRRLDAAGGTGGALLGLAAGETDMYSAVALNDALSFYGAAGPLAGRLRDPGPGARRAGRRPGGRVLRRAS